jgi:hypothetical protein
VNSLGGNIYNYGSLGYVLNNQTKYANLDLSGSTFTSIERIAFASVTNLTSVIIGGGVTTIESQAFSSCTSLTSITIPNSRKIVLNNSCKV